MDQENLSEASAAGLRASYRVARAGTQDTTRANVFSEMMAHPMPPPAPPNSAHRLWAQRVVLVTITLGFSALLYLAIDIFQEAPPIPDRVTAPDGTVLFTGNDIREGQQVFLKYGLLDNKAIWTRKPKESRISSELQNTLALHGAMHIAKQRYGLTLDQLTPDQRTQILAEVSRELKRNHYDPKTRVLAVSPSYGDWYKTQPQVWQERLSKPSKNAGSKPQAIHDQSEIKQLSAFVAWTEWASSAQAKDTKATADTYPVSATALLGGP